MNVFRSWLSQRILDLSPQVQIQKARVGRCRGLRVRPIFSRECLRGPGGGGQGATNIGIAYPNTRLNVPPLENPRRRHSHFL